MGTGAAGGDVGAAVVGAVVGVDVPPHAARNTAILRQISISDQLDLFRTKKLSLRRYS